MFLKVISQIIKSKIESTAYNGKSFESIQYERQMRGWYPNIQNLAEILSPLGSQKCLVAIDNPGKVNLIDTVEGPPLIVRTVVPFMTRGGSVWGPENFAGSNLSVISGDRLDLLLMCPYSQYFADATLDSHDVGQKAIFCYHLNVSRLLFHAQSLRCVVYLFLFSLPPTVYEKEFYLKMPGTNPRDTEPPFFQSTIMPTFKITLDFKERFLRDGGISAENMVILMGEYRWGERIRCGRVILFFTATNISNPYVYLVPGKVIARNLTLIKMCNFGLPYMVSSILLNNFTDNLGNLSFLLQLALASPESSVTWQLPRMSSKLLVNVFQHMVSFVENCVGNRVTPEEFSTMNSSLERIGRGFADVLVFVMGNYTIHHADYTHAQTCRNGVWRAKTLVDYTMYNTAKFSLVSFARNLFYATFLPQNQVGNFHFVSCGRRGLTGIPFRELICLRLVCMG